MDVFDVEEFGVVFVYVEDFRWGEFFDGGVCMNCLYFVDVG